VQATNSSFEQRFRLNLGSVFDSKVVHKFDDAVPLEHLKPGHVPVTDVQAKSEHGINSLKALPLFVDDPIDVLLFSGK